MRIVLATTNAGKIRELAEPLSRFGMEVVGLDAFPDLGDIEENGQTFEENALIKARTVCLYTGLVTIADDSGLEVAALQGAPGVHSARYSDDWHTHDGETRDARNIRKLLHEMAKVPENQRQARFVTCMAAVKPDGKELVVHGVWNGRILTSPLGDNGFGYDPVFFDDSINKSAALLTRDEKNERSHRGNALRALLKEWETFME